MARKLGRDVHPWQWRWRVGDLQERHGNAGLFDDPEAGFHQHAGKYHPAAIQQPVSGRRLPGADTGADAAELQPDDRYGLLHWRPKPTVDSIWRSVLWRTSTAIPQLELRSTAQPDEYADADHELCGFRGALRDHRWEQCSRLLGQSTKPGFSGRWRLGIGEGDACERCGRSGSGGVASAEL